MRIFEDLGMGVLSGRAVDFCNLVLGGKECLLPNHRDSVLKERESEEFKLFAEGRRNGVKKMRIFEDLGMGVLCGRVVDFSNLDLGGKECLLPNHRDSVLKYTVRNLAANELSFLKGS
ncbi:hypothetical protein CEXT_399411 [Caerostris extrusa]|uniref:Uncharacterized protein n=1 Tax=Caerostris extrusa TaxID=172846 RepID=A0AAV4QNB3_CAEEX|nr:hypothetical protein CEXT_399411 [Caerostris extrusa]